MNKRVVSVTTIFLMLAFFAFSDSSWARDFVVHNVADLQDALTTAQSNGHSDKILIKAGTYPVTTTLTYEPSDNHALTIVGEGSSSTILDGGESVQILNIDTTGLTDDSKADITIKGLTFQNGFFYNFYVAEGGGLFVLTDSADITVKDSVFYNNVAFDSSCGSGGGAAVYTYTGEITFTNNAINNNYSCNGAGASVGSVSGIVTIADNIFTNNGSGGGGGGIDAQSSSGTCFLNDNYFIDNSADFGGGSATSTDIGNIIITNNIFSGNGDIYGGGGAASIVGRDGYEGGTITFTNNTITGNRHGILTYLIGNNATLNLYNNIIWGNTEGYDIYVDDDWYPSDGVGANVNLFANDYDAFYINVGDHLFSQDNIDQDPLLSADYQLQESSPCINAGTNDAPFLPHKDFEGDKRIIDRIVDIGADEYRRK